MNAPEYTIGTTIKRLRRAARITQQDLADHCGVTRPCVALWETLRSNPEVGRLPSIAAALNTSIKILFTE